MFVVYKVHYKLMFYSHIRLQISWVIEFVKL